MKRYIYDTEKLRADVNAGWDLILITNRRPDRENGGQTLSIYQKGILVAEWFVSTALEGYKAKKVRGTKIEHRVSTPLGRFVPLLQIKKYRSSKWDEDMPFSTFFTQDRIAFHAAASLRAREAIGTRASAGCIRLMPQQAEELFGLIKANFYSTLIVIHDPSLSAD